MTAVTLEEFAEQIKNNEAAVQKLRKLAEERNLTIETVTALAAEYDYEIIKEIMPDIEQLSDDDLEDVAGGEEQSTALGNTLCRLFLWAVGWEEECD